MGDNERTGGGVFATKPFTRAPLLLLRSPAVFAALAGAALILSLVAASTPLYLSSAGSNALEQELGGRCPSSYAINVDAFTSGELELEILDAVVDAPRLGTPIHLMEGSLGQARSDQSNQPIKLMYRTGFADDMEVVDRVDGEGLWMGERLAGWLGVDAGDTVVVANGSVESTLPIVAITTDLFDRRTEQAWCQIENLLEPTPMGDLPTPLVFVDEGVLSERHLIAAYARYGDGGLNETWTIPIDAEDLTTRQAEELSTIVDTTLPSVTHSDFTLVATRVEALVDALGTSIDPLSSAVLITAVGLMGVAGSYWVERRRPELRSLAVRGLSPAALGIKAGLEAALPIGVGAVAGWLIAGPVVAVSGPGGKMDPGAFAAGGVRSLLAAIAGLAAVAVVAGVRSRRVLEVAEAPKHGRLGPILPLAFLGTTVWVRSLLGDSAVDLPDNQLVGSIDPLVVLYPMLAFTGAALAGGYVLVRVAPLLARLGAKPGRFLAFRRISSAPMLATVLVVGAAIPVATLIYSATLTRSTVSTIDAKGRTFIGADVSTIVYGYDSIPTDLEGAATVVGRVERAGVPGSQVDVLAVDPATFTDGAFFDPTFADEPIDELLAGLGPMDNGAIPAIIGNVADGESPIGNGVLDARNVDLPIRVIGITEAFPGAKRDRPMVVVSREGLQDAIDAAGRKPATFRYFLWTNDLTPDEVISALDDEGIGHAFATPATRTLDLLKFQSVVWTFDFLELFAALAGLIAIGAILLYSDTRQRARNLAYALARRMGLTRAAHLRSSLMETAIPLIIGTALGAGTALVTAATVYSALDPVPETPPGPRWVPALDLVAITFIIALVLSWTTAWISQRAADTADTSELLRHGG